MNKKQQKILGVDPGYGRVGFGIIEEKNKDLNYIDHGCIETSKELELNKRLIQIKEAFKKILAEYNPDVAAVEELFFCKNVKTAIDVGQARGVILLSLSEFELNIEEYTPKQIKSTLTGKGNADKKQVQEMVKMQLDLVRKPNQDDAADALAVAICSSLSQNFSK